MKTELSVLMITHKRQSEATPRSLAMAVQLVKRGHHVTILTISPDQRWGIKDHEVSGVHVVESPDLFRGRLRSGWDPWDMLNRIYYLSKTKAQYDLIHCFETRPITIYPALNFKRKRKIPMITDWNDWWGHHGLLDVNRPNWYRYTPFAKIETFYEEAFRKKGEGLTVIATALEERALQMGIDPLKIMKISGGSFTSEIPVRSKAECRLRFGLSEEDVLLGFGSANSHFDLEIIMASLVIVREKYPAVKLIVTGKAKKEIYDFVQQYGLEDNILFTGFLSIDDYFCSIACADVCVLPMADQPYNWGRWPNKMGDYLCVGRPTVSNPVGDIQTLFEKHQVGLLAEYQAEDFARQILFLLDHPEIADVYGQEARRVAETEYDWKFLTDQLETFYFRICKDGAVKQNHVYV